MPIDYDDETRDYTVRPDTDDNSRTVAELLDY